MLLNQTNLCPIHLKTHNLLFRLHLFCQKLAKDFINRALSC